jgi:hypothetical protein
VKIVADMKSHQKLALALAAGAALGAAAVQAIHAQARPPAYVVGEIDITDPEGYAKEFGPLARKALAEGPGYKALVLGGKSIAIAGSPPGKRVIIGDGL